MASAKPSIGEKEEENLLSPVLQGKERKKGKEQPFYQKTPG